MFISVISVNFCVTINQRSRGISRRLTFSAGSMRRKVPGFSEKGLTFLAERANLSWTRPPSHSDKERCILNASTKVRHFPEPLAGYGGIEHGKAA